MKSKKLELFLEFLIFGIIMGIVEDLLAISLSTGSHFSWKILFVVTIVTIPFAAIGELIVDRAKLAPKLIKNPKVAMYVEFLVFGILMGIAEDLIAVVLATGASISPTIVAIVLLVTIPFAAINELIVDRKGLISTNK